MKKEKLSKEALSKAWFKRQEEEFSRMWKLDEIRKKRDENHTLSSLKFQDYNNVMNALQNLCRSFAYNKVPDDVIRDIRDRIHDIIIKYYE